MSTERQENFFDICVQCRSSCCLGARPPLTGKRRKIIEAYLKKQKLPLENAFARVAYTFPREDDDGYCIFYNKKTKKCHIHPIKPETCAAGPVTFDINKKTQKIEWHLKKETICLLAGKMHKNKKVLQKHLESAKKELLTLIRELDSNALKAILKIEEPETFKIGEEEIEKGVMAKLNQ